MTWFRSEQIVSSGGEKPEFDYIKILDNPTGEGSFTLTDDYHNYDLLQLKLYNNSSTKTTYIYTTPTSIDKCRAISDANIVNFNEINNNQYIAMKMTDNINWALYNYRSCIISEINGMNCTNLTCSEYEIFTASGRTSTSVDIVPSSELSFYDYIFFSMNSSGIDEIQPSSFVYSKNDIIETPVAFAVNPYNTVQTITISDFYISPARFAYVAGIKFT